MKSDARRRLGLSLAALAALDWSLPFGFLNRLFFRHRWFPTNLTQVFVGSMSSPDSAWSVLVVSASAPRFWTMGGLLAAAVVRACRRLGTGGGRALILLAAGQALLFLAAEFLLPWADANGWIPSRWADLLFPPTLRGHGRAYGWLHLPAVALFALSFRRKTVSPS